MTALCGEGVIKFRIDFEPGPAPEEQYLVELNRWRGIFIKQGLLGQDPYRYDGLGFGNLSRRLPCRDNSFVITGTQTGHLEELTSRDYSTVISCSPRENRLEAKGPVKPSSEALSHGILYQLHPEITWVMHLHSTEIFNLYNELKLPFTDPRVAYGTPEMAEEIAKLVSGHDCSEPGLLVMAGHKDGILAFGGKADDTGDIVLQTLARARDFSRNDAPV